MPKIMEQYGFRLDKAGFCECPFHSERSASFKAYPGTRGYYCFGCGAHGSVIDFVMLYFGLSFKDALAKINEDFSLGLPGLTVDVQPIDDHRALRGGQTAGHHIHGGALSGTVWPQQSVDPPRLQPEIQVGHCLMGAVSLCQVCDFNQSHRLPVLTLRTE